MLVALSLILCLVMAAVMVQIAWGYSQLETLDQYDPYVGADAPLVSIIIPACNEEAAIGETLRRLSRLRYTNLEIIVVDDRSTDNTAEIIESVRSGSSAIRLIRIKELPDGWLGKPHALQQGAQFASGRYILFMDADVGLEETVVSRAVVAMEKNKLDQLTLIFQNSSPGLLLNTLIADIGAGLFFMIKPWKVKQRGSRFYMGVGAFNMVRSSVYRAIGEHQLIKQQVIDDVYLGKLVKQNGYHQECMLAESLVTLNWYRSVQEMIDGLMKNVYAFFHYRLIYALVGISVFLIVVVLPILGAVVTRGVAQWFFICAVLIRVGGLGVGMIRVGLPPFSAFLLLFTPFLLLYIIIKAVIMVHRDGGVVWRQTHYDLEQLRTADWVFSGLIWNRSENN